MNVTNYEPKIVLDWPLGPRSSQNVTMRDMANMSYKGLRALVEYFHDVAGG